MLSPWNLGSASKFPFQIVELVPILYVLTDSANPIDR